MNFSVNKNKKRQCPECQKRGQFSSVKLFQANKDLAIYSCENKNCLYPFEDTDDPSKSVVRRSVDDITVNAEMLRSLQLPETLLAEPDLRTRHLDQLVWLSVIHPYIKTAVEIDRLGKTFMKKAKLNEKLLGKHLARLEDYYDPDMENLKKFSDDMVRFGKHIVPDLESIMKSIRS